MFSVSVEHILPLKVYTPTKHYCPKHEDCCMGQNEIDFLVKPLALAYESLTDAVSILDKGSQFVYVNSAFEELYGYTKEELEGQFLSLILPKDSPVIRLSTLIESPTKTIVEEVVRVRKNREEFPARLTLSLLNDSAGEFIATVAVVRDLTEEKLAEQQISLMALQQTIVGEIGRITTSTMDLDEIYDRFAEKVREVIPFDRLAIDQFDETDQTITRSFETGVQLPARKLGTTDKLSATFTYNFADTFSGIIVQSDDPDTIISEYPTLSSGARLGLLSSLAVPLISNDKIVGALHFRSFYANHYTESHKLIAESIASQIGGPLVNAQLHRTVEMQAEQQAMLAELGRIVTLSLRFEQVYDLLSEQIQKLVPFDNLSINLIDLDAGLTWRIHRDKTQVPGTTAPNINTGLLGTMNREVAISQQPLLYQGRLRSELESDYPRSLPFYDAGFRSFLTLPLFSRGQVIASLHFRSKTGDFYSERNLATSQLIATQISDAVANYGLYEEIERESEIKQCLAEIGQIISSSLNIEEVYETFADKLQSLIEYDRFSIVLFDEKRNTNATIFQYGASLPAVNYSPRHLNHGGLLDQATSSTDVNIFNTATLEDFVSAFPGTSPDMFGGFQSMLTSPLVDNNKVIGILAYRRTQYDSYTQRDAELAKRISEQVVGAIVGTQLHALIREEAKEREVLAEISRMAGSSLNMETAFHQFAD